MSTRRESNKIKFPRYARKESNCQKNNNYSIIYKNNVIPDYNMDAIKENAENRNEYNRYQNLMNQKKKKFYWMMNLIK